MAKLTVSLLSLLVLFYSTATNAADVCKQGCQGPALVRCAELSNNGKKSYSFINPCEIKKQNSCNGQNVTAKRVDASMCNNDPTYKILCAVIVAENISFDTAQGCILQNQSGAYKQGEVIGVDAGLGGFCAPDGKIANPEQCSAQG